MGRAPQTRPTQTEGRGQFGQRRLFPRERDDAGMPLRSESQLRLLGSRRKHTALMWRHLLSRMLSRPRRKKAWGLT